MIDISLRELGNQQSRYYANMLAGVEPRLLKVSPDLFIRSKLLENTGDKNPLLETALPLVSQVLAGWNDLLITPFPHDIEPAILIADPLRDRGYHQVLLMALKQLTGKGVVNSVSYEQSFYKY